MAQYSTANDVYRIAGITSNDVGVTDVEEFIKEADEFIDNFFNTTFQTKQISYSVDGNCSKSMFLRYYPIVSIDSLTIDGINITPSKIYIYKETGKITLKDDAEVTKFYCYKPLQISLTYTYGYDLDFTTITNNAGWNKVAYLIRSLSGKIAAMATLANQIGGTFDDVTSYSLPEFTASKGEPYTNILATIKRLENEIKQTLTDPILRALAPNIYFA